MASQQRWINYIRIPCGVGHVRFFPVALLPNTPTQFGKAALDYAGNNTAVKALL